MQSISSKFYETSVSYATVDERGFDKRATDVYCVSAQSFSEAEALAIGEFALNQAPEATKITLAPYHEAFLADTDDGRFYRITANAVAIDEKTGKKKRIRGSYLVQALDIERARASFENAVVSEFEVVAISETKITGIIQ